MHRGLCAVKSKFEATSRIDANARGCDSGGFILEQAIRTLTPRLAPPDMTCVK